MPPRQPVLGSQAVFSPARTSRNITVDPSTCHNLSLFKELMREYRKLDDTVTMRLNRTMAQFRDRDRTSGPSKSNPEEEACAYFWQDLIANWKKRTEIVDYCVGVLDQSIDSKRKIIENEEISNETEKNLKRTSFEEEAKRNQMHNELAVETIIRQRSLDAFRNRCRYFEPPLSDAEARKWWEKASKGR